MYGFKEPSNADRAEWAREALEVFAATTGVQDEPLADQIGDLITDLLHLARREGEIEKFDATKFATSRATLHDMEVTEDEEGED